MFINVPSPAASRIGIPAIQYASIDPPNFPVVAFPVGDRRVRRGEQRKRLARDDRADEIHSICELNVASFGIALASDLKHI